MNRMYTTKVILIVLISFFTTLFITSSKSYENYTLIKFHIKQNEGFKNRVYLDTLGNLTVGYGHKLRKADGYKLGDYVATARIDRWFQADFNTALRCARVFLRNDYNQKELIVITDMAYNLGCKTLNDFWRLRKHINNKDYSMAIRAIKGSNYYKQVTNRANRNIALLK